MDALSSLITGDVAKYVGATAILGYGLYSLAQSQHVSLSTGAHGNSTSSSATTSTSSNKTASGSRSLASGRGGNSQVAPEEPRSVPVTSGHASAAHVAYGLSDAVFVYTAGEHEDIPVFRQQPRNCSGHLTMVRHMEARAGLGSTVTGALANGEVAVSVLLPSSCLPLMIPSLYQMASQRSPCVMHVPSRAVNDQDLSVSVDTSDVLTTRGTGAAIIWSHSAQECHDMAVISHAIAQQACLPVIHSYDGVRVARESTQVHEASFETLRDHFIMAKPTDSNDTAAIVTKTMKDLAGLLGREYAPFEYFGSKSATTVLVFMGVNVDAVASVLAHQPDVGAIVVRMYRPWSIEYFLSALPASVKQVCIVEATAIASNKPGPLFNDVVSAFHSGLWSQGAKPRVTSISLTCGSHGVTSSAAHDLVNSVGKAENEGPPHVTVTASCDSNTDNTEQVSGAQVLVWVPSDGASADVTTHATRSLAHSCGLYTQAFVAQDSLFVGGTSLVQVSVGEQPITSHASFLSAGAVVCANPAMLTPDSKDLVQSLQPKSTLVLIAPEELDLPAPLKHTIAALDVTLYRIDAEQVAQGHELDEELAVEGMVSVLLGDAIARALPEHKSQVLRAARAFTGAHSSSLEPLASGLLSHMHEYQVPASWINERAEVMPEEEGPRFVSRARLAPASAPRKADVSTLAHHRISWNLMFQAAYGANESALRPDVHETVYRVTLTKNERLTPTDYDRNVFHLEFDTSETALSYQIGDALGIYGLNDAATVAEWLTRHEYDPSEFVSVVHNDSEEVISVQQVFEQRLDLFGKPTQKFYDAIAPFAEDSYQRLKLEWLGGENKEGFQLRQLETMTFADVLDEFDSVKLPLTKLIELVPAIKPRHYSIASSSQMRPGSVHLLVVLVDWKTPKGRSRYGQCTRYLDGLAAGTKVTVDIVPSILRLPADPATPVVMAGLGTGMAPFRAFIEERAYLKSQGHKVGPMVLYFGSRYRAKEWLYGEELERYEAEGLVELRLAFSRDQPEKVYIQHKLLEDKERLHDLLCTQKGHFYLCGPTWPVPDVRAAIAGGIKAVTGMSQDDAEEVIEQMKEESRYVLEVY